MRTPTTKSHHLHGIRVILFGVSLVALCLVRVETQLLTQTPNGSVLAYATNTNRGDLAVHTNSARAQHGLGGLSMNGALNNSAQAKANDMIARNYWSHNTPDGTQPWWFFSQAGYSYQKAGENLAYGFADSASTVNGWMNSPAHKANILGAFTEVGFGIASGAQYQGGENTVVVAHYATPAYVPPAPPPPPPTPPAAPVQPSAPPAAPSTPTPPAPTPETPVPSDTATPTQPKDTAADKKNEKPAVPVSAPTTSTSIPLWRSFQGGAIPLVGVVSLLLLAAAALGYGLTHRALMKHALISGENYALHHPMVDLMVLATIALLVLLTTVGRVG